MTRRAVGALALAAALSSASLIAQGVSATPPDILVTRQLAEGEGLKVGDIVQLATDQAGTHRAPFRIAGIYEPTPDPARLGSVPRGVRMHLPDLLALTREPDTLAGAEHVDAINLRLTDPADADAFARDVSARMPGVAARPASQAAGNAALFVVLERFHFAIAAVTITAATVFLLALTIMLVDERRETVGILRLIGLPARRILTQVLLEGLLIAAAGAVIGLVLAALSQTLINRFFQWRYDTALIFVRITPDVAGVSLAIAIPLGVAATVVASWALLRRNALRLARR